MKYINVHETFEKLIGLHCWDVYYNKHLNLSMSFGDPIMRIREPEKVKSTNAGFRLRRAHRLVTIRGEWWFWLLSASWKLSVKGYGKITDISPLKQMRRGLALLDGQILTGVSINPRTSATEMIFDLGAKLSIRRLSAQDDSDIWSLYQPNGHVLSVRADGKYHDDPGKTAPNQIEWKPIAE
jgi:hypothetical protein